MVSTIGLGDSRNVHTTSSNVKPARIVKSWRSKGHRSCVEPGFDPKLPCALPAPPTRPRARQWKRGLPRDDFLTRAPVKPARSHAHWSQITPLASPQNQDRPFTTLPNVHTDLLSDPLGRSPHLGILRRSPETCCASSMNTAVATCTTSKIAFKRTHDLDIVGIPFN